MPSSLSVTVKMYRIFLRECKTILQPKYSELWKAVVEIHADKIKQLSSISSSSNSSRSSSSSIGGSGSSSDEQLLLTKIIKDPKQEIKKIFQHATAKDMNVFFSMTSYELFRYSRAAIIIDRYHRAAATAVATTTAAAAIERNDIISFMNRLKHNQHQHYEGRRYIDGAIMISKLYYNETQLKAFLPHSMEQIVSMKMKLWRSLVQSKIEVELKQSSIAVEQVPNKNDSAKRKYQSKQMRECEKDRSDLLAVLRGVHKEVMIHAGTINHDTYRGFNNNYNNNSSSSSSSGYNSSNSGLKHIHIIDQFMHPCIDSFTSRVRSIMFAVIFCDIMNSLNQPIEATYVSFFNPEYPPLVRIKTKWSISPYQSIPPYYKKIDKKSIEDQDRGDHVIATASVAGVATDSESESESDVIISNAYSDNETTKVFTAIGDRIGDDNALISADNEVIDNDNLTAAENETNNDRYNDSDDKNGERYDDNDNKDNEVVDWSSNSSSSSSSPKQAVIETMSHSICNKVKGKGERKISPLFPPPMNNPSTKSIDSGSNSSSRGSSRGSSSSSNSRSSSNSNIDLDFVPQLVNPQHLTGRWVACDYNDDDFRFQEVMVSYGRNGSLEAYKLERNGFIEANRISWKINFNGDNNYKTVGKKIRVGASYKAEVQIALPRNMEPEFISYNFKLHALPMSTFLSKSESLQLHHYHQEQQHAGVPRHSSLSSSSMMSSSSSIYYEIELVARHRNPNKRASHTCQRMSYCRTVDLDRCLFNLTNRGVVAVTPVQYLNHIIRDKLPQVLEPASTIDIARKMAGDLANAYISEDTGMESHDESSEQRSRDIAKDASYWQTIFRSLKKST